MTGATAAIVMSAAAIPATVKIISIECQGVTYDLVEFE